MSSPAVIIKSKFIVQSNSSKGKVYYNDFLNYMDRKETRSTENNYETYHDYMGNEKKSKGLFTNNIDNVDAGYKKHLKEMFKKGQEKNSNLWLDVISFDNEWLKEIGVLDEISNHVDEEKIKNATRKAVNYMLKEEDMLDSSNWVASIHYNTDNIHVHVATTQYKNIRERGKRKPKTIEKMKSNVINNLIDRSKENNKVNDYIRNKFVKSVKNDNIYTFKNRIFHDDMTTQFNKIYKSLPNDKRLWKYNMNALKELKPDIDKLSKMFLEKNYQKEMSEFDNIINKNVNDYKRLYGKSHADKYKENVYNDLYTRMGNAVLNEMKEHSKTRYKKDINKKLSKIHSKYEIKKEVKNSVYHLDRYIGNNLQSIKNQREFEQMEYEKEL